jgi:ribulose-phosphate 3-epimerase
MKTIVSPSLLAADFANLKGDINMINRSDADWLHCDVMDGTFVPNISFWLSGDGSCESICNKPLDVHFISRSPSDISPRRPSWVPIMNECSL